MSQKKKALIIIDVQKAFDNTIWGERNNLQAEENISRILKLWRDREWLVIHVRHVSNNPHSLFYLRSESVVIKEIVKPIGEEIVIEKTVNSSFIGTNLETILRDNDISQVVITGLTTPHCVSTTTRMSGNLGFETYLVSDGTAAFSLRGQDNTYYDSETIHTHSLVTLHDEFATVLTTEKLIREFLS